MVRQAAGLPVDSDVLRLSGAGLSLKLVGKLLWLAVLFPPAALAALYFAVPFVLVRRLGVMWGEIGNTTAASHKLIFGIPLYPLWHALGVTALWHWFDPRIALAWALLAPFAGALALTYGVEARRLARLLYDETKIFLRGEKLNSLRTKRDELRTQLATMAREYDRLTSAAGST